MAPHSSTLAWKIPWTEEPGRLQFTGSHRVRHNWVTSLSLSLSPLPLASVLYSALFKASSDNPFCLFCIFFPWEWSWSLPPVQCHEPPSIVLQALYHILFFDSMCHFYCIIIRDLISVIHGWVSGFPCFLQFKSEFGNKEFMIWDTVSSRSCFCWLYRASPSLASNNIINLTWCWPSGDERYPLKTPWTVFKD